MFRNKIKQQSDKYQTNRQTGKMTKTDKRLDTT